MAMGRGVSFSTLDSHVIQLDLRYDPTEPSDRKCMTMIGGTAWSVDDFIADVHEHGGSVRSNIEQAIDQIRIAGRKGEIGVIVSARCGIFTIVDAIVMPLDPMGDLPTPAHQFNAIRCLLDRGAIWQDFLLEVQKRQEEPRTASAGGA